MNVLRHSNTALSLPIRLHCYCIYGALVIRTIYTGSPQTFSAMAHKFLPS